MISRKKTRTTEHEAVRSKSTWVVMHRRGSGKNVNPGVYIPLYHIISMSLLWI